MCLKAWMEKSKNDYTVTFCKWSIFFSDSCKLKLHTKTLSDSDMNICIDDFILDGKSKKQKFKNTLVYTFFLRFWCLVRVKFAQINTFVKLFVFYLSMYCFDFSLTQEKKIKYRKHKWLSMTFPSKLNVFERIVQVLDVMLRLLKKCHCRLTM